MTVLTDTWRFLVARRLLPAAGLLLAALIAVPMVLAKTPEATPVAAVKADNSTLATEPIVSLGTPGDRAERRHVLGTRKNPFKPQATPTPVAKPKAAAAAPSAATPATSGAGATSPTGAAGGSAPGGPTGSGGITTPAPATPVAPGTQAPATHYDLAELTVRFGPSDATDALPRSQVKRLEALPSAEEPVLIYLGVLSDKKTAVFLVDSGVVAQGDGTCAPSRNSCETIHLKEGETEFLDVPSDDASGGQTLKQYELDLVKIRHKATTSAKAAAKSFARVSKAGQKIVRARIAGDGPLRLAFSKHDGRLHKLSKKAFKAAVAKVARAKAARARAATSSRNRAEGHS